jgi:hypothetical protein
VSRRRILLFVATVLVLATTAAGTSGFDSASVDRGVTVTVADDSTAYLGVEQATTNATNGTTNLTVTLRNRFPTGATLAADIEVGNQSSGVTLGAGEADTTTFQSVDCGEQIAVDVSGPSVDVSLNRTVSCA